MDHKEKAITDLIRSYTRQEFSSRNVAELVELVHELYHGEDEITAAMQDLQDLQDLETSSGFSRAWIERYYDGSYAICTRRAGARHRLGGCEYGRQLVATIRALIPPPPTPEEDAEMVRQFISALPPAGQERVVKAREAAERLCKALKKQPT